MRRWTGGLLLLLAWAGFTAPQTPAPTADPIVTESLVRAHMEALAGDAMNGRGSGTADERAAAEYIGIQFRRWGVEPLGDNGTHVQTVTVRRGRVTGPPELHAGDLIFTHGVAMLVQNVGGGGISGPLVKLQGGGQAKPGTIVLLPPDVQPGAATAGAAAVLMLETSAIRARWAQLAARTPTVPVRLATRAGEVQAPQLRIILSSDAHAAVSALDDGSPMRFVAPIAEKTSETWNALGRLTGSDPAARDEILLLSAHLDHLGVGGDGPDRIFNGADDDASGVTAVLGLAEALAKGPRPRRTVIFALFGSEEDDGLGAAAFVELPPVPLDRFVANLEFEMIGRPDALVAPHTLWLTGYDRSDLGRTLAEHGARLVADPHPEQQFFERSDNIQLARAGVVAQTVSSYGMHADYHRPSDDVDHIDVAHMAESIQSMLEPIVWFANSTFKPTWAPGKQPR
jgi:hypothetical protein